MDGTTMLPFKNCRRDTAFTIWIGLVGSGGVGRGFVTLLAFASDLEGFNAGFVHMTVLIMFM